MKRLAAYCRVSTDRQKDEQTIEVQETFIKEWAFKNDTVIVDWYKDDGWSGDTLERPELDRLREDANRNIWQGIIFIDRDRLARTLAYQEYCIREFRDKNIEVIFLNNPLADTPLERAIQQVYGIVAEIERITTAERMRKGKIHKAKSGKIVGYSAPFGYRYVLKSGDKDGYFVIDEAEAEIVKMIFHWVADERYSMRRVVKELYERKIPPPKKRSDHWGKSAIQRLLNRQDYIGITYYNKGTAIVPKNPQKVGVYKKIKKSSRKLRPQEEWISIPVPAILEDKELFYRAKQRMRENFLYGKRNKTYNYLLTGKVMCACGSKRVGDGVGEHHYYRCAQRIYKFPLPNKCAYEGVNAEILDQMVWNKTLSLLSNPETIKPQVRIWQKKRQQLGDKSQGKKEHIESVIGKLTEEENRYTEAFGAGLINFEKFKELTEGIKAKKATIESQKIEIITPSESNDIMGDFDTLCRNVAYTLQYSPVADRQERLRTVIESIYVGERNKAVVNGRIPVVTQPQNIQYEFKRGNCGVAKCGQEYVVQCALKKAAGVGCELSFCNHRAQCWGGCCA